MGRARDARARPDPRAPRERAAVRRRPHRRMPARHHGDRQPRARAARWRGRGRAVRVESALDTGRCRRRARRPRRHLGLRAEGRGPRHLLPAHQRGARDQTAHHDGRRRRCRDAPPHKAPRAPPRREGWHRETTTGVIRLRAMAEEGVLKYPIVAVNEAQTKHMFDNQYGTGQSAIDGLLRATNLLLAGKSAVVCGYGWVGRGVAERLRGMGAIVTICEVDPLRGLEAAMDGFQVATVAEAAKRGDVFFTATGNLNVIGRPHFGLLKDGAILANVGHFNDEIELGALAEMAKGRREIRRFVEEYQLPDKKKVFVLAEGRLLNHAAAEANPAAVMDMSFANQALSIEYLLKHGKELAPRVYPVPRELDEEIARRKLEAMGMRIDTMSAAQAEYARSWKAGT